MYVLSCVMLVMPVSLGLVEVVESKLVGHGLRPWE